MPPPSNYKRCPRCKWLHNPKGFDDHVESCSWKIGGWVKELVTRVFVVYYIILCFLTDAYSTRSPGSVVLVLVQAPRRYHRHRHLTHPIHFQQSHQPQNTSHAYLRSENYCTVPINWGYRDMRWWFVHCQPLHHHNKPPSFQHHSNPSFSTMTSPPPSNYTECPSCRRFIFSEVIEAHYRDCSYVLAYKSGLKLSETSDNIPAVVHAEESTSPMWPTWDTVEAAEMPDLIVKHINPMTLTQPHLFTTTLYHTAEMSTSPPVI